MRQLTTKWNGECAKCGADLPEGTTVQYEKSMGIFCPGCEPTDVEEIRSFRLAKAERKASRLDEWAQKREQAAGAQLNSNPEIRHDWAFVTQPGHIPFRDRMNRADDKAYESLRVAKEQRAKAHNLRQVRVAGDAERRRQASRDRQDAIIHKGTKVQDVLFGVGEVVGVYKKSYRIKFDSGGTYARDKSYILKDKNYLDNKNIA